MMRSPWYDGFDMAAGSVCGRDHSRAGKNNQDAYHYTCLERALIAVVCDGCSSGRHSEVGAQLGARLMVRAIQQALDHHGPQFWCRVQARVLAQLGNLAEQLGTDLPQTIQEYCLFTVLGALVTAEQTTLFALGDGFIALNGELIPLGPFPHNAPPYLAYALVAPPGSAAGRPSPGFHIVRRLPTARLQSLLLGTDGLEALRRASTQCLPGRLELAGPLSQFWEDERYFTNPDAIRRRLTLLNREVLQPDWEAQRLKRTGGLLSDDTTLVVLRRRAGQQEV